MDGLLILLLSIALLSLFIICNRISELKKEKESLIQQKEALKQEKEKLQNAKNDLQLYHKEAIEEFDTILAEKSQYYPILASIMADLCTVHYEKCAMYLEYKSHPAYTEAKRIRELRIETKAIFQKEKVLEYQLSYIRELFPNIDEIFDNEFDEAEIDNVVDNQNIDYVRKYISEEEYQTLSTTERNQLALDNYLSRKKSKWQIGRDYEMYIGYLYENKGFRIEYNGIIKKLEDLGRDLIAKKQNEILIIQCKNWSQEKEIHEKHVFQLYGSVVLYKIQNPQANVKGVFITSTQLSSTAKDIATYLKIEIKENLSLGIFPRIKCNINQQTGEKIYHLPFDQQYDKTIIDKNKGECFASTVAEAEQKGFRRAFKYKF